MSIGESAGGLPPDSLVEGEAAILNDMHPGGGPVPRPPARRDGAGGLAPCSPFSVSRELMRDAALLARDKGVMLHTHLAENDEDIAYSLAQVRLPPRAICRGPGLDRPGCLARPLREARWFGN
jgi:cytosine/adenosine deaminase-related metal-dependent hydrolase